jgi:hypothetical protein
MVGPLTTEFSCRPRCMRRTPRVDRMRGRSAATSWFGRPLCRRLGPRSSFLVGRGGGVEPPGQVAHLVGGSDFPLRRRRANANGRASPPSPRGGHQAAPGPQPPRPVAATARRTVSRLLAIKQVRQAEFVIRQRSRRHHSGGPPPIAGTELPRSSSKLRLPLANSGELLCPGLRDGQRGSAAYPQDQLTAGAADFTPGDRPGWAQAMDQRRATVPLSNPEHSTTPDSPRQALGPESRPGRCQGGWLAGGLAGPRP